MHNLAATQPATYLHAHLHRPLFVSLGLQAALFPFSLFLALHPVTLAAARAESEACGRFGLPPVHFFAMPRRLLELSLVQRVGRAIATGRAALGWGSGLAGARTEGTGGGASAAVQPSTPGGNHEHLGTQLGVKPFGEEKDAVHAQGSVSQPSPSLTPPEHLREDLARGAAQAAAFSKARYCLLELLLTVSWCHLCCSSCAHAHAQARDDARKKSSGRVRRPPG